MHQGSFIVTGQPRPGDSVTFDGVTYTFIKGRSCEKGQVLIGNTVEATARNLRIAMSNGLCRPMVYVETPSLWQRIWRRITQRD